MENCIKIGHDIKKESVKSITDSITAIFDSAHENNMDQSTVQEALMSLSNVFKVENIHICDSTFIGEKTINTDE